MSDAGGQPGRQHWRAPRRDHLVEAGGCQGAGTPPPADTRRHSGAAGAEVRADAPPRGWRLSGKQYVRSVASAANADELGRRMK